MNSRATVQRRHLALAGYMGLSEALFVLHSHRSTFPFVLLWSKSSRAQRKALSPPKAHNHVLIPGVLLRVIIILPMPQINF